jgi:hypothetical protein
MRSTIDCFQFNFSPCLSAIFPIIVSTSAIDSGVVAVTGGAEAEPTDELGAAEELGIADGPAGGGAPAACADPKIADAMLPKMLILSSWCDRTCRLRSPDHPNNRDYGRPHQR